MSLWFVFAPLKQSLFTQSIQLVSTASQPETARGHKYWQIGDRHGQSLEKMSCSVLYNTPKSIFNVCVLINLLVFYEEISISRHLVTHAYYKGQYLWNVSNFCDCETATHICSISLTILVFAKYFNRCTGFM